MKRIVFTSKMFKIEKEEVKIGGKKIVLERNIGPKIVVIIPLLKKDTVLMEKQYRLAIKKHIYELPAGIINPGEDPEHAARREVEEETGYKPKNLRFLFRTYSSPGWTTEELYFYSASGLKRSKTHLDEMEVIEVMPINTGKLLGMVKNNTIKDNKSIAGILYYLNFCK